MFTVALLAVQDCMYSSLTGPFDLFSVASFEWGKVSGSGNEPPLFKPVIVGSKEKTITAFNSTQIAITTDYSSGFSYDIVFVPVIFSDLNRVLDDTETIAWLDEQGERGPVSVPSVPGLFYSPQLAV